ncbi:UbiH/UbiF/VisC/COQ6 family ubiquinone biosynthesis hydroxylase [Aliikangiella sp. G2MR2-5]|uniref:UbiH/UbiF/VisC/COQ6 family ubiquinone biosynthesis hydroxylase n=1 Tax=Aliikangiella sp. G2MR2-5 TaxID=2788943 RepID=UPI0018AA3528|nr:UbiH/UbiF/VisC/COQ6 family ubiquinone biosynthesis hydroxylase [Aliikangiella sp. G2MR2-5]
MTSGLKANSRKFDIIIVGGGMVGLAMAASLCETGLQIAVIEKQSLSLDLFAPLLLPEEPEAKDFDIRVSAISPANQELLSEFHCWQKIPQARQGLYEKMTVWDGDGSGEIHFDAADVAAPYLGCIVENRCIQGAILMRLAHQPTVKLYDQNTVSAIVEERDKITALLEDGTSLAAKLLIGADGSLSKVREMLGVSFSSVPYKQTAFVANVKTELGHQQTAWQRFTSTGPIAFLPMANPELCSIVWTADDNFAEKIETWDRSSLEDKITRQFESRLGRVELVSQFQGFPLVKRHAESYLGKRVALIGDAAHTIHPLAGQGVNLGFQDVASLSRLIKELFDKGRDFGWCDNLRPFERERKLENRITQESMSALKTLFGENNTVFTISRNLGLNWVNHSPSIKSFFTKKAMGW